MDEYVKYANGMGAREEVLLWMSTALNKRLQKSPTSQTEVEHIIDYLVSDRSPRRLLKMSYADAKANAKKWSEANQKKGRNLVDSHADIEPIHQFSNGSQIVKLKTKKAMRREGYLMRHCVGDHDPENKNIIIYSYRDKKNNPHATFELRKEDSEITQIKGKGNGPIHPKYIDPILVFLKSVGVEVRSHDMKNLGYYHIDKTHLDFVRSLSPKQELSFIYGEAYVFVKASA